MDNNMQSNRPVAANSNLVFYWNMLLSFTQKLFLLLYFQPLLPPSIQSFKVVTPTIEYLNLFHLQYIGEYSELTHQQIKKASYLHSLFLKRE